MRYLPVLITLACGGSFPEPGLDGQAVSCGQLDEPCCTGLVNDAAAEVCNNNTACEDGACIAIIPVWDVDAAPERPDAVPVCGVLGYPCCLSPANLYECYAPYACVDAVCQ